MVKFHQIFLLAIVVAGTEVAKGGEIQSNGDFICQATDPYYELGLHIGKDVFRGLDVFTVPASYSYQLVRDGASYVNEMEIGYSTKRYFYKGMNIFSMIVYRVFYYCPFSVMPDFRVVFEKITPDL